ncbi:hypothetical protein Tco_0030794 [Tanacetum coccineum]
MSDAEAEYVSLSACCTQVIWMRTQLLDYGYRYTKIPMYSDSKSAIAISCNPNIPCFVECKIVGQIQIDHVLSYALTTTADVPAIYLQQFWKTASKLPMKTPDNPFIAPSTIEYIQPFMKIVGSQGEVDKVNAFFTKCLAQPWQTMFKKFPSIPPRLEEDYHFIKDDIPLVGVYTTGNVIVRGMLIPDEFFTNEIRATEEYKEYMKVFIGFQSSTSPIPTPTDNDDDSDNRIEPRSQKEHPEIVVDDDKNEKEKKDDDNDDDDVNDGHTDHTLDRTQEMGSLEIRNEKIQTLIPSPHRSPMTNLSLDKNLSRELTDSISPTTATTSHDPSKSKRISNKYTHIPGALRRICMHQDIMINQTEKKFIASNATNDIIENNLLKFLVGTIMKERDTFQETVPDLISKEFVDHAPKLIEELFHTYILNNVITIHPTTSSSTHTSSSIDLQHQLYLKMKTSLQAQADDLELWEVLKCKFEKSSASFGPCRTNTFRGSDHDDHQDDDASPEGVKRAKRRRTSKSSKSARGSSSKQPAYRSETYISKRQHQQQEWDTWVEEIVSDIDKVIPEKKSPEDVKEFQDNDEHVPTIYDHERMEATLKDMMSNQFRDAEEYAYHLE